ncbi:MAG: ROK family protein [Clostridia bacterium]
MKIGIDIGGSHVGVGLVDRAGKIILKKEKDLVAALQKKDYNEILINTIVNLITNILDEGKIDISQIELIGIAVPGTVSDTEIIKAENLHIRNFDIVSEINKYFNIPIQLRNDAKCAAVAEKMYGSLEKYEDAVFLTIGTGIGGAVFMGDKLLKPKQYEGFEIGHMIIKKGGIKCNCGNLGCFERYASIRVLKEKISKLYKKDISSIELKEILLNMSKNEKVQRIIEEYIDNLSIGLANLINIFEPEVISIGGSFVYYKEQLIDMITLKIKNENLLFNDRSIPKIVTAKLKNDAGIVGSVVI